MTAAIYPVSPIPSESRIVVVPSTKPKNHIGDRSFSQPASAIPVL